MCAKIHARPKRHGGDHRGSAAARRASKRRLLREYGDGTTCRCFYCGAPLTFETVERDRVEPGGPYAFWNLRPADRACNLARSNNLTWTPDIELSAA